MTFTWNVYVFGFIFKGEIAPYAGMLHRSYTRNVVVTTAIIVVFLTGCQAKPIRQEGEVFCDFEKHQYYRRQTQGCTECDRCWPGEEPALQGVDLGMGLHGATKCPTCRDCDEGTYNPDGDIYWNCLTCTVCSDLGMIEVQACTTTQDTKCSNTSMQAQKRLVSTSTDYSESVQVGQKQGEDLPNDKVTDVSVSVVVTVVVTVVVIFIICGIVYHRKTILRKIFGEHHSPNTEESAPLNVYKTEPDCTEQKMANEEEESDHPEETDDQFGSIRDMRTNERAPLLPKRKRYKSCGDYENVGKDEKETCKRGIPAFQRQLSHPATDTEKLIIQHQLDEEDEKKRPSECFIRYLSKLLAPNKGYKAFAEHMGLEKYKIDILKEGHEERHRNLHAEDISYDYTTMSLQCKPKLTKRDIYDALTKLKLTTELENIREKRHRFRV